MTTTSPLMDKTTRMPGIEVDTAINLILAARHVRVKVTWCREQNEANQSYVPVDPHEVIDRIRDDGVKFLNVTVVDDHVFLGW